MRSTVLRHRNRRTGAVRRGGFTLLELLCALSIVAVISFSLFATIRTTFKGRESADNNLQPSRDSAVVMEVLRTDLQGALPATRGTFEQTFEGTGAVDGDVETDDLIFSTTAPASAHATGANGDIKQIEITCYKPNGSNDYILVRRTLNNMLSPSSFQNSDGTAGDDTDEEVLCRNVRGFNVQYTADGITWQDTWDSTQQSNSIPAAVMVTLTLTTPQGTTDGKNTINFTRIFQLPCVGAPPANGKGGGS